MSREREKFPTERLKGLELARYVLHKLQNENSNMISIAKEFDGNERFVASILDFLKEIDWISEDENGIYRLTSEGHKNCLDSLRF